MTATTTENTIAALTAIFAIEGYPKTLVSDNGPQLTSDSFNQFCQLHEISHITTAPFHPASNGLAERFVQTFKTSVSKNIKDGYRVNTAVTKYLRTYRFTPNSEGKTPAELLHGRPVRTILSQLFEKRSEGCRRSKQSFIKRHINQIKPRSDPDNCSSSYNEDNNKFWWAPEVSSSPATPTTLTQEEEPSSDPVQNSQSIAGSNEVPAASTQNVLQQPQQRRSGIPIRSSTRQRRVPSRYSP
ncbi:uncharacterized protein LOC121404681 [Drosophila obscura]|uniref:uncharacterized protein LOC121404681 n=1 Tax=Drosophila obscura TaxID=7282 RepID=UPI001BB2B4B1|nr:uncharacterized protein LOC121404681 [Drosophila obscura]